MLGASIHAYFSVMVSRNDVKNSFSKISILFSHIAQSVLLVSLRGCFKKADIQFKRTNVLHYENGELTLKVFHPAPEHTVKSHSCLSNE